MPNYMAVKLFIKYGSALALLVVIGLCLCLGWLAAMVAVPWPVILAGSVGSLLVGLFILIFVDLTKIIAEMLLPR